MVHFTWVILVEWLELGQVCQGCLRRTTVAGSWGCAGATLADWLDHLFSYWVMRWKGKKVMASSDSPNLRDSFSSSPLNLTDALGLIKGFSSWIIQVLSKLVFFFTVPQGGQVCTWASKLFILIAGYQIGGRVLVDTVSPCLLPILLWSFSCMLCRSCSISSQFFLRRNCWIGRCRFMYLWEGVSFRSSYASIIHF